MFNEELNSLLQKNPLLLVDKIITEYAIKLKQKEYELETYDEVFTFFKKGILEYLKIMFDEIDMENAIFEKRLDSNKQRFIAICLLRLLEANDEFFEQNETFRRKTFILFDEVYKNNIYTQKSANITQQSQGYEKESKLKFFLESQEKQMQEKLNIQSLDNINSFKKNIYSKLFNDISVLIFQPFWPMKLISRESLGNIIKYIDKYVNSEKRDKIENYEIVIDLLNEFTEQAEEFLTSYCIEYIYKPFRIIKSLIESDFDKSQLGISAELVLEKTEKKYPFNLKGSQFKISVIISNLKKGYAFNTNVNIKEHDKSISFEKVKNHIGEVFSDKILVEFGCELIDPKDVQTITFELVWENFKRGKYKKEFELSFNSQNSNVDWDKLELSEPYSWEPVEEEDKLVGRKEILNRLWNSVAIMDRISSFYIYGQKRVGKTSIVKTLNSKLENELRDSCIVLYIEGGEYKDLELCKTISNLGNLICEKITEKDDRFSELAIPKFDGALNPLISFLNKIEYKYPKLRIIFILDEFDEISSDIFIRQEVVDSLFLTVRAISNKKRIGFLLVGGEKMDFIISCQGEKLNKFQSIRVDYFNKSKYLSDFQELARKPVEGIIEFTDKSLEYLYNQTAGNPFFTIIICDKLFKQMIKKRDTHVTEFEMEDAVNELILENNTQIFSHFWEDGIKAKEDKKEEISMNRRKVLIAIGEILQKDNKLNKNTAIEKIMQHDIEENIIKENLEEFVQRQVLYLEDEEYKFKINIFKEWLMENGINNIITTIPDRERYKYKKKEEELAKIKSSELVELQDSWEQFTYNGKQITSDMIRCWLEQFETNIHQRLMFKILQNVQVYSEYNIGIKMVEIYRNITKQEEKNFIWKQIQGKRKRDDILVSYLEDDFSKSGIGYARRFTEKNNILAARAVERLKVINSLEQNEQIKVLLFVDDFIGTGQSICDNLEEFVSDFPEIKEIEVKIYIGIITGFIDGKDKVIEKAQELGLNLDVIICDPLGEENKCFSEKSNIFLSCNERKNAKDICYEYGVRLENKAPYGYGDLGAHVVFPTTCPNDCLPIMWKSDNKFKALFPRKL